MEMSAQIKALFLAWLIAPFIPLAVLAGMRCILRKFAGGLGARTHGRRAETRPAPVPAAGMEGFREARKAGAAR